MTRNCFIDFFCFFSYVLNLFCCLFYDRRRFVYPAPHAHEIISSLQLKKCSHCRFRVYPIPSPSPRRCATLYICIYFYTHLVCFWYFSHSSGWKMYISFYSNPTWMIPLGGEHEHRQNRHPTQPIIHVIYIYIYMLLLTSILPLHPSFPSLSVHKK